MTIFHYRVNSLYDTNIFFGFSRIFPDFHQIFRCQHVLSQRVYDIHLKYDVMNFHMLSSKVWLFETDQLDWNLMMMREVRLNWLLILCYESARTLLLLPWEKLYHKTYLDSQSQTYLRKTECHHSYSINGKTTGARERKEFDFKHLDDLLFQCSTLKSIWKSVPITYTLLQGSERIFDGILFTLNEMFFPTFFRDF